MKQVLHVGQFFAIKALVFCLGLLKTKTSKTNTWRGPSQSKQIAPFEMGIFVWKSVVLCAMKRFINGDFGSLTSFYKPSGSPWDFVDVKSPLQKPNNPPPRIGHCNS
jgi:hypothetical protein